MRFYQFLLFHSSNIRSDHPRHIIFMILALIFHLIINFSAIFIKRKRNPTAIFFDHFFYRNKLSFSFFSCIRFRIKPNSFCFTTSSRFNTLENIPSIDKGQYGFSRLKLPLTSLSSLLGVSPAASSALSATIFSPEKLLGTCQQA